MFNCSQINYFRKFLVGYAMNTCVPSVCSGCVWLCTCTENLGKKSLGLTALGRLKQENYYKFETILGQPNLRRKNNIWETGNEGKKHKINEICFHGVFSLGWNFTVRINFLLVVFYVLYFSISYFFNKHVWFTSKWDFGLRRKVYLKMKIK